MVYTHCESFRLQLSADEGIVVEDRDLQNQDCEILCYYIAPGSCHLLYPQCEGYRRQLKTVELFG